MLILANEFCYPAEALIKANQKAKKPAAKAAKKPVAKKVMFTSDAYVYFSLCIVKAAKATKAAGAQPGKNAAKSIGQAKAKRAAAADKVVYSKFIW